MAEVQVELVCSNRPDVTTFLDRSSMVSYLKEISWETEVWGADLPSRMIRFNGERFLGPHEE